ERAADIAAFGENDGERAGAVADPGDAGAAMDGVHAGEAAVEVQAPAEVGDGEGDVGQAAVGHAGSLAGSGPLPGTGCGVRPARPARSKRWAGGHALPHDWEDRLRDILRASAEIRRFVAGMDEQAFRNDPKTRMAVLAELSVIGDAAAHLPRHVQTRRP